MKRKWNRASGCGGTNPESKIRSRFVRPHRPEKLQSRQHRSPGRSFLQIVRQAKRDEGGQAQSGHSNLASGGLLSMISPVSDTFK